MSELMIILRGKKNLSTLPYLSRRRMDKCRGKVHWAALIRDNHIPYFQVMPHLIADVSRYWLSVFWKPATEPAGSLVSVGALQNAQTIWEQWAELDYVYLTFPWMLHVSEGWGYLTFPDSYHKTAMPLCFTHTRLLDILQIYHLILKLFYLCVCLFWPSLPPLWEALTIP